MTTTELIETANRRRDYIRSIGKKEPRSAEGWLRMSADDRILADAMTLELDPTPITAEWLLACGGERCPHDDDYIRFKLVDEPYPAYLMLSIFAGQSDGKEICFGSYDGLDESIAWPEFIVASAPSAMATRGQLRTLCRALGVKLNEEEKT